MVRKTGRNDTHSARAARATNRCVFRVAPDRQRIVKTLMAAALLLLCAGCTKNPEKCRDEVAAAFERLRTSGRPYRKETISVSGRQTFHEITEFVPPDRMRQFMNNGVPGYENSVTIRIGRRAWSNDNGWRECEPGLAQEIYGAGMDSELLPDRPIVPADSVFECLGRVEFNGTMYIGYRSRITKFAWYSSSAAPLSEKDLQELSAKVRQMPPVFRTVFVDWPSMLPAYDLVAQENQIDKPRSIVKYAYPASIEIAPPVR